VWLARAEGHPAPAEVGFHFLVDGRYRPPVASNDDPARPPQTIISEPVQTARWAQRGDGHLALSGVAVQVSEDGS
jgi:hypothetical protein